MPGTDDTGTSGNQPGATNREPLPGISIPGEELGASGTSHGAVVEYDKIAREKGWRPKEEFEGPEDVWVGAEEFIKRQPLYDKLKSQNKQLKELSKTVDAMAKHYNITIAQVQKKAIKELQEERREAIELGEVIKVEQLDEQIAEVKNLKPPVEVPLEPEISSFIEANKDWFNKDKAMTRFAISFNESYLIDNPGDLEKSLEETLKAVKAAYPDKFKNQRRNDPPPVETGGSPQANSGGKYTLNRLTSEQKLVYNQLVVQHKQMSHEAYFKSLEEAGYLEG